MTIPTIDPCPTPPSRLDPATFRSRADAFLGWFATLFTQANALATWMNGRAGDADTSAQAGADSAEAAATSELLSAHYQATAIAAVNFKGNWADLSGALALPASVYYAGRFWMLLQNTANVASDTPGVSAKWANITIGFIWIDKAANYTAVAGDGVRVNTSGGAWTLKLPASPVEGDEVAVVDVGHTLTTYVLTIDRNALKIMGLAEDMTVRTSYAAFTLHYSGTTKGWVIR